MRNKLFFSISFILGVGLLNVPAQKPKPSKPIPTLTLGVLNGKAISLAAPGYPQKAKLNGIGGEVNVEILIDEQGNVISAKAVSGHVLFRTVSVQAARQAKFPRTTLSGVPVRVKGILVYKFTPPADMPAALETELLIASQKGDLATVRTLLLKGVNVNAKSDKGLSPLMFAAGNGHLTVIKALIAKGANVNAKNDANGFTPLLYVKDASVAEFLIAKGADVNAREKEGATALMMAKNVSLAQILISRGADVNAENKRGTTALITASIFGRLDMVQLLVNSGANVHAVDNVGKSALSWASSLKKEAIVRILTTEQNKPCPASLSSQYLIGLSDRVRTAISLKRNDRITIIASGIISFGPYAGSGGPEGIKGFEGYSRVQGISHGALIARLADDEGWYDIGADETLIAKTNGTLELAVNDADADNNSGQFEVRVSICKAPSQH